MSFKEFENILIFSKAVERLSVEKAKALGVAKEYLNKIKRTSRFHALGKVVECQSDDFPTYNEISWAVLCNDPYFKEDEVSSIYWTEARFLNSDKAYWENQKDILSNLSKEDLNNIFNLAKELGHPISSIDQRNIPVPSLFSKENSTGSSMVNSEMVLLRACVVSAIRVLEKESFETIKSIANDSQIENRLIESSNKKAFKLNFNPPKTYDEKRFKIQKNAIKNVLKNKTTIVKAPSGFGKTLMGCLYASESNKRVFWVCPRNVIAETVFDNIKKELQSFNINMSLELYLTGERKKTWEMGNQKTLSDESFSADIVVTNIDSLLKPSVSDLASDKLFDVINSNIVFDEYHELLSDAPLFSAFVYLMRLRHRICENSNTLLLSATPNVMEFLWDTVSSRTNVLPNKNDHFPPVHSNPYFVNIVKDMPDTPDEGGLTIYNAIKNAQEKRWECDIPVHSKYDSKDREIIMKELHLNFSKASKGIAKGLKVVSSPLIQASMDLSFKSLKQSIISPEDTLQRIGRVNRWGEQESCNITFCIPTDAGESAAIKSIYDFKLRNLWCDFLKDELTERITLRDLYSLYNKFYDTKKYFQDVKNFILECHKKGSDDLEVSCTPLKFSREREVASVSKTASTSKNLRNPFGSYFVTIRNNKGDWIEPFTCDKFEMDRIFTHPNNDRNTSDYIKVLKELVGSGFSFDSEVKKLQKNKQRMSEARFSFLAKRKDTPFPDASRIYERLGNGNTIKDIGRGIIEN
jgi:CRISPR-associated endonuclease/helicase Cas3